MKLGKLYFTRGINHAISEHITFSRFIVKSLERYGMDDWGEMCEEDKEMNDLSVQHNDGRVVARYKHSNRDIYIITDIQGEERNTTILFCDEY